MIPGFPGNQTEMQIQVIEAFGASRPTDLGLTALDIALIDAIQNFTGGGGGTGGNTVRLFPISFGSGYANGQPIFDTNGSDQLITGSQILDWWPQIIIQFDGLQPQLDLLTGGTNGFLTSFPNGGLAPMPLWVPDVGLNPGLTVAGIPAGPRASQSWSSAVLTQGNTPVQRVPINVTTGGTLQAAISQDGTADSAVAASVTGSPPVTFPFTVTVNVNDQWAWGGTDPITGGGGRAPEIFTVAPAVYQSYNTTSPQLLPALNGALGALSSEPFSNYATVTTSSSNVVVTNLVPGAAANGNTFGSGKSRDITSDLGFNGVGLLGGGLGGDPGSTQGMMILYLLTATPS